MAILLLVLLAGCEKKPQKSGDSSNRKYSDVYASLSSHAKARMSLNQFEPDDDDAAFAEKEKSPLTNVTAEQFGDLMKKGETKFGTPHKPTGVRLSA